jgi:peroxiredoxin
VTHSRPPTAALLALAALLAFTVFITWRAKRLEGGLRHGIEDVALLHQPAPDFTLPALDGHPLSLSDFRGKKPLLISFWASWCGPCRMEMPVLREFYKKARKANVDFELVAISIDDDPQAAQTAATQLKLPFPVLLDTSHAAADAFRVDSIPTLMIVDKSGKIAFGRIGFDAALQFELNRRFGLSNFPAMPGAPDARGH